MRLDHEFYRLPLRFDDQRLRREVEQFAEADWRKHPQGHKGNTAISFVGIGGDPTNDQVIGPMSPTPHLARCPYVRQIMATLGAPAGRTRLMRIEGHGEANRHCDTNYYWQQRTRVHVPIITTPGVRFECGDKAVYMGPGECWTFDTWRLHNVTNPADFSRVHLVIDTIGSDTFWELVERGEVMPPPPPEGQGGDTGGHGADTAAGSVAGPIPYANEPTFVPYNPDWQPEVVTERSNFPVVMTPWEQGKLIDMLLDDVSRASDWSADDAQRVRRTFQQLNRRWHGLWAQYGPDAAGAPAYQQALDRFDQAIAAMGDAHRLPNGMPLPEIVRQYLIRPALHLELATALPTTASPKAQGLQALGPTPQATTTPTTTPTLTPTTRPASASPSPTAAPRRTLTRRPLSSKAITPAPTARPRPIVSFASRRIVRPIIIVSAPRSGSSLLFETLARSPSVYTIGGESHAVFENLRVLNPAFRGFDSNRLTADDAGDELAQMLHDMFIRQMRDREGKIVPATNAPVRLLEKTPKNALRVPFLNRVFPDAFFVFLYRRPEPNLASIIEAWQSGRFVTYPQLPEWAGPPWSMLLIPGWRDLIGQPIAAVAAEQWRCANETMLNDLEALPTERWTAVAYEEFLDDPQLQATRLCRDVDIEWDQELGRDLPLSRHTLTPPDPNKWRKHAGEIEPLLASLEPVAARARAVVERCIERSAERSEAQAALVAAQLGSEQM
jgi:Sulfotransferase family/Aspartyl/Asparaginyl beta-hydroxylase